MTVEKIFKTRRHTKLYDINSAPDRNLVESLINKTFDLVPSKQNLMPYKLYVLGPDCVKYKEIFFEISKFFKGGGQNYNIKAPYVIIFTRRLIKNPNDAVLRKIKLGHTYSNCDPEKYHLMDKDAGIEIGMFSEILSALCLEHNIDISYILCFPSRNRNKDWEKLSFIEDEPLFSMQLGFKSKLFEYDRHIEETKPSKDEVITWIKG
jgi:hypothetical protein